MISVFHPCVGLRMNLDLRMLGCRISTAATGQPHGLLCCLYCLLGFCCLFQDRVSDAFGLAWNTFCRPGVRYYILLTYYTLQNVALYIYTSDIKNKSWRATLPSCSFKKIIKLYKTSIKKVTWKPSKTGTPLILAVGRQRQAADLYKSQANLVDIVICRPKLQVSTTTSQNKILAEGQWDGLSGNGTFC